MLDAAGDFFEERVLPQPEHRPSAGAVVGTVVLVCWSAIGCILLIELL